MRSRVRLYDGVQQVCPCAVAALVLQDLVSSFQSLCTAAADQLVPGELDVSDLVKDASMLSDAVNISRDSVIEWMEMQEELLVREPKQSDFVFRVKQSTHGGRQV